MRKKELNDRLAEWRSHFFDNRIEGPEADHYLEVVGRLMARDLPPVLDFEHLALMLGIVPSALASMVNESRAYYHDFEIPKKSGGTRLITAPYPSLKYVQRWIYSNILSKIKPHGCAHGFINKRSILTNAKVHAGQPYLLKIDIKDFFPSIGINWVIQMFRNLGYETKTAFYLAALCCLDGVLPQGSPASPAISNIVSIHMDRRLYRLAKKFGLNYSRYADDIAFSGKEIDGAFIRYACHIIEDCGFTVNEQKIRLYKDCGNKILTGISLANGKPRSTREFRRNLVKELFFIRKYGIDSHMSHSHIRKANYLMSIIGKLNFWLMIEPDNEFALSMYRHLYDTYRDRLFTLPSPI